MKEEQKLELYQDIVDKILNKENLTDEETNIQENDIEFVAFQKEFTLISEAIRKSGMSRKLEDIKELEKNYKTTSTNVNQMSNKRKWLIAAVMLFLVGLTYLVLQLNRGGNYDKDFLIADNTPFYTDIDATRGAAGETTNKAYLHYKNRDTGLAIKEFEKLMQTDNNPKHKFYLGICLIYEQQYQAAQNILQHESLKNYKEVPINYYLALTKIGTDDPKEAIELLSNPTLDSPILDGNREKLLRMLKR